MILSDHVLSHETMSRRIFKDKVEKDLLSYFSAEEALEILVQRRHVAAKFSSFADSIARVTGDQKAKAVVSEIVRDEYENSDHRLLFEEELLRLGVDGLTLVQCTDDTVHSLRAIDDLVYSSFTRSDAYKISLLRFFGEIVPGVEYEAFHSHIFVDERSPYREYESVFLKPHVIYDAEGTNDYPSHADQYLSCLHRAIHSDGDAIEAVEAINHAHHVRWRFYDQFLSS